MPSFSTPYVKNIVRRGFTQIADPELKPAAADKIWDFFDCRCAYCRRPLKRGSKDAHIDHLVSASQSGRNGIGNRVLACAKCNENKRDQLWKDFLKARVSSPAWRAARRNRIRTWQQQNRSKVSSRQKAIAQRAKRSADDVIVLFERRVKALRAFMKAG